MAAAAPIHTGSGRYRLAITMVAIIVLSGSSATKMSPKVMARTEKFIARSPWCCGAAARRATAPISVKLWSALLQALQAGVEHGPGRLPETTPRTRR